MKINNIDELRNACYEQYQKNGVQAVIDLCLNLKHIEELEIMKNVQFEECTECDCDVPSINHECLICGQTTKQIDFAKENTNSTMVDDIRQQLVNMVIDNLVNDIVHGDFTVLEELLQNLPNKTLIASLPEENWKSFEKLN